MPFTNDVVVVGGCGHVGLPLGLAFAERGLQVSLLDVRQEVVEQVMAGEMPFTEDGADSVLKAVVGTRLIATTDKTTVSTAEHVVVVVGTPVDEHLNPDPTVVSNVVDELSPYLRDGQLLVLRSTVYPGTTVLIEKALEAVDKDVDVVFCPERIAEGKGDD